MIAQADYLVNGVATNGFVADNLHVHFELSKSGSFDYGNGTCVMMVIGRDMPQYLDTRYDVTLKRDGSNFRQWSRKYLRDYIDKKLKITKA